MTPTTTDRLLAVCKIALLQFGTSGEASAVQTLLTIRERCTWGPARSMWLQHTGEVLVQGALLRRERRRAAELLDGYKQLLMASDGAADAAWCVPCRRCLHHRSHF